MMATAGGNRLASFATDKWLAFVIEHHKEIESLNEVYEFAKKKLPVEVNQFVVDSIMELKKSFFPDQRLKCERDDAEIRWFDSNLYNSERGVGPYFAFEYFSDWKSLVAGNSEDAPYLTVYLEPEGRNNAQRRQNLNEWKELLREKQDSLAQKDIVLEPDEDDPQYLASYYLHSHINLHALKTPDELRKGVQDEVKEFTSAILSIMQNAE